MRALIMLCDDEETPVFDLELELLHVHKHVAKDILVRAGLSLISTETHAKGADDLGPEFAEVEPVVESGPATTDDPNWMRPEVKPEWPLAGDTPEPACDGDCDKCKCGDQF